MTGPREYRITFTRLTRRGELARRGAPIPPLDMTAEPMGDAEIASAVRRYLAPAYVRNLADVTVSARRGHGVWGTVTRAARGGGDPVPVLEFHVIWRIPAPPRGRGRPAMGPLTTLRLPPDLRERLDGARHPGESMAGAARRLLAVALSPGIPAALAIAADYWDAQAGAACLDSAPPAARAEALHLADSMRAALAEFDPPTTGSDAR